MHVYMSLHVTIIYTPALPIGVLSSVVHQIAGAWPQSPVWNSQSSSLLFEVLRSQACIFTVC